MRRAFFFAAGGLTAALAGCYAPDSPSPTAAEVMSLSVSARTAPADGATTVQVAARIAADASAGHRNITFATTSGSLGGGDGSNASVPVDAMGLAVATLRAPADVSLARIRVSQGDVVRQDSVVFVRAEAEQVLVDPEHFSVQAGTQSELHVTAYLRRFAGKVTPGAEVRFRALREDTGEGIGRFGVAETSNSAGTVTVRFTPGATAYRGRIRITATAVVAGQPGPSGSAAVDVVD
jgi:hypothetical protein